MREHQVGQDRSVKPRCGRLEGTELREGGVAAFMYTAAARPYFRFLARTGARNRRNNAASYRANRRRMPQPREKPAASKTPLHAAKELPSCQPLWQPLFTRPRAPAREGAETALLTSLALRSAAARRAVTTADPPPRIGKQLRPCGPRS